MSKFSKILTILFITLSPLADGLTVAAQSDSSGDFVISPSIIEMETKINSVHELSLSFSNNTEFPILLTTELTSYQHPQQLALTSTRDASEFISLDSGLIAVEANTTEQIQLEVSIPALAQTGSFFAMLVMKPVLPPEYYEKYSTQVTPQLASVIAINVVDDTVVPKTDFLTLTGLSRLLVADKVAIELSAQNNDIYYRKVSGTITIQDLFGNNKEVIVIADQRILPEHVLTESFLSSLDYGAGYYRVLVELGDEGYTINRELNFFKAPKAIELVAFLTVFMSIAITFYYKRNILKATKVLIGKGEKS